MFLIIVINAQVARRRQHEERREGGRDRAPRLESRGGTSRGALPGEVEVDGDFDVDVDVDVGADVGEFKRGFAR